MNNTELANFKKKLSIELETTTSDEAQLISNIVDSASAGALPAVSADDNGKVLTVSSGAWAAAQPSGGGVGNILLTPVEYSPEDGYQGGIYSKTDGELFSVGSSVYTSEGLDINALNTSNFYMFGQYDIVENMYFPYVGYAIETSAAIDSGEVAETEFYIESGTKLLFVLVPGGNKLLCFVPSTSVIKQGTNTNPTD